MTRVHSNPDSGVRSRYVVYVPRNHKEVERLPVILFLNGFGENGTDGLRQISNNFGVDIWRKRDQFPFLAVCPQCSSEGGWNAGGTESTKTLAILDEAINEFGGDSDRVYLTGVSSGGYHVWTLANAHPDRFAAIVPISAGSSGSDVEKAASKSLPVWTFYNGGDQKSLVQSARASRELMFEAGLSPLVTEFDREGHNAWFAYDSPPLYSWLLRHRRSENVSTDRFHLWESHAVKDNWDMTGGGTWAAKSQYEIHWKGEAEEAAGLSICPEPWTTGEVHADAFLSKGEASHFRLLSQAAEQQTCEVVVALASEGVGGIRFGDGTHTEFDPVAQSRLRSGWNDVRISRNDGRLSVSLNGWPALDVADPFGESPVQWALSAGPGQTDSRWRYLRTIGSATQDSAE
ncbi:MAG: CocE/NonD family hydrolase [Planctomycetaceae bacterium]